MKKAQSGALIDRVHLDCAFDLQAFSSCPTRRSTPNRVELLIILRLKDNKIPTVCQALLLML